MMRNGRISCLSFFAALAIVAWHCKNESLICNKLIPLFCHWAVSWFALVSGAYAVCSLRKYSTSVFLIKKIHSVLIPYGIWCIVGLFMFAVAGRPITYTVEALFGIIGGVPLYNSPLWFLRSLMLYFIVSAAIMWCIRHVRVVQKYDGCVIALILICVIILLHKVGIGVGNNNSCVCWFAIGLAGSHWIIRDKVFERLNSKIVFIAALIFTLLIRAFFDGPGIRNNMAVAGTIFAILGLTDGARFSDRWSRYVGLSMPIYVIHMPVVEVVKSIFHSRIESDGCEFIIVFFCSVIVSACIPCMIKIMIPRLCVVLYGGR